MEEYLFAYGFLKSQFHGDRKTETPVIDGELIGTGFYTGRIYRVDVFPGVIYDDQLPANVKGEVFKLFKPEDTLHILDRYENAKPLVQLNPDYERVLRPIQTEQGTLQCWVYEYLHPVKPSTEIAEGEFCHHTLG